MSTMITRLLTANKTETTSGAVPGTIPANSVGIYTSALTSKNSVSIKARVKPARNSFTVLFPLYNPVGGSFFRQSSNFDENLHRG